MERWLEHRLIIAVASALFACSSDASGTGAVATAGAPPSSAAGQVASGGAGSAGAMSIAGMPGIAGAGGAGASGSNAPGAPEAPDAASGMDAAMLPEGGAGTSGDGGTEAPRCDPEVTRANRTLVALAIDELFVDKDITAVDRHWADPYHQHNPIARSGVSTFRSFMSSIISSPSFTYERLLTLADCDLVVVYGRYSQTGVIFDMFRVQDDKIMEHWDSDTNQASAVGELAALDGGTAETGALFASFSTTILLGGETERAGDFLAQGYIEHHGTGATGPAAFSAFLEAESVTYTRVHHVIADGNYVFALSEGTRGPSAYGLYDLFRVEGGKLVEHWDSRRVVPSSTMSGLGIF